MALNIPVLKQMFNKGNKQFSFVRLNLDNKVHIVLHVSANIAYFANRIYRLPTKRVYLVSYLLDFMT